MTNDAADRFARSARFWLRAYPRRWREARGDEVVDLLADLGAPGARRLGARTAASTVRAGWRERRRTHPPFGPWLAYRVLDRPLPAQHRPWVRDDIRGAGYLVRVAGWPLVLVLPSVATERVLRTILFAGLWLGVAGMVGERRRLLAARRHLPVRQGEPLDEHSVVFGLTMRLRWEARRSWTMWTALAAVATACGGAVLAADRDLGAGRRVGVIVAAGALGAVAALVGAPRVRRLAPRRPRQHARWLVGTSRGAVRGAWAWGAGVVVLCVSTLGDGPLLPGAFVVAGLVALPVCVVGLRFAVRDGDDLAAVDVATIVLRGRVPRVDTYVEGLVPASRAEHADG